MLGHAPRATSINAEEDFSLVSHKTGSKTRPPTSTSSPPAPSNSTVRVAQQPPARSNLTAPVKLHSSGTGDDASSETSVVRENPCTRDEKGVRREENSSETTDVARSKDSGETPPGKRPASAVTIKLGAAVGLGRRCVWSGFMCW